MKTAYTAIAVSVDCRMKAKELAEFHGKKLYRYLDDLISADYDIFLSKTLPISSRAGSSGKKVK